MIVPKITDILQPQLTIPVLTDIANVTLHYAPANCLEFITSPTIPQSTPII